jgi:hypothetical protein
VGVAEVTVEIALAADDDPCWPDAIVAQRIKRAAGRRLEMDRQVMMRNNLTEIFKDARSRSNEPQSSLR